MANPLPRIFALLMLLSVAVLPHAAHAGYTETLTVQVFDQVFRPVQGALVYVDYQLNSVQGDTETRPLPTNSSGYITLVFTDYEQITSSVDPTYKLYVRYGDQLEQYGLTAVDGEKRIYTGSVQSYYAFVKVHDQKGRPVQADVSISGGSIDTQDKNATATGDAVFQLPPGNYTLRTEYNGIVKNRDLLLSADQAIDVVYGSYPLDITITDDNGNPLAATVTVGTQVAQAGPDGKAHLDNISDQNPSVVIKYADRYKTITPDLSASPSVSAVFDLNPPSITDLHSTLAGDGSATVTFFVQDKGAYASGVGTVDASYSLAGVDTPLQSYTVGYNTFEAKIPAQPAGTLVKYSVKVSDKDGNTALGSGSYIVPGAAAPATPSPSASPIPSVPSSAGGVPLDLLAILVAAGLLVAYATYYYLKRKNEEIPGAAKPPSVPSSQRPPVQPPQAPPSA